MEALKIDVIQKKRELVLFIRETVRASGLKRAVLGLSGGVDSSLVAALAKEALGAKNVLGIYLPYGSHRSDANDVDALVKKLGIRRKTINIAPMVNAYFKPSTRANKVRRGNFMARQRMAVLYDQSKDFGALVFGTGNRTECLLGYFTLYGDSGCALNPVAGLYKTQVWQMARALGIPDPIVNKKPSAGLWPDQTDEGELGFTYREVDRLLYAMIDKKIPPARLQRKGFSKTFIAKVRQHIAETEFKRRPSVTP
ncbi:MAG: NAD+ synthase [Candidatus Omnitrophota bacterium]